MARQGSRLRIHLGRTIVACAGFLSLAGISAPAQVKLEPSQPVVVRAGTGVSRLKITNAGSSPQPLKLSVGIFLDETSHAPIEPSKISFLAEAGGDLPPTLAPGQSVDVRIWRFSKSQSLF